MTVSVFRVRRNGDTSVVNVWIRAKDGSDLFTLGQSLSDHDRDVSDSSNDAPDGLRLIDGRHKKAYLPATTAGGRCLCSPSSSVVFKSRESQWWVSVTFAAPPKDVTAVNVSVPTFGTFSDVPVV